MSTIIELVNSFDPKSKDYEEFLQDLLFYNGDIPFDVEDVETLQSTIISNINARLNQSHTRYSGLIILDKILSQCSKDVMLKYSILWITKATQALESIHSNLQELTLSCKVLGSLIIKSKEIPELQKQISMQNVKHLISAISNLESDRKCGAVYYLIAVLLQQYPEVCERFQVQIKKIILFQIDSREDNLVNATAICYALLAKATERSFKPPPAKATYNAWVYSQAIICNTLHSIMDELFSNLIELESIDIWEKLELPQITQEHIIEYYTRQKQRFSNLCAYLSSMIGGCDKKNSVSPHDILRVLCRGLAIQPSNLKDQNSFKEQMLYLILPKLHIALLSVLDTLITGFREQLVPFGSTILQLFHQTLQWTEGLLDNQSTVCGYRPFKNVRISVYKCLSSWLVNTNSLSGVETVVDEYLPCILKDIVPERDRVLLTIQKNQNLSKKAMKRLRDSQYEKSVYLSNSGTTRKQSCLDVDVCNQALIVLQNIFFSCGAWLKPVVFKTVQNIVVPLIYDSYLTSAELKFYKDNSGCRLELLKVLKSLQINPHSLTPPPTQYCIEIFEMALNDNNVHIIQESKMALAELEKVVHPNAPTLQLTHVEEVQKEFIATDQDEVEMDNMQETTVNGSSLNEDATPISNKRQKLADPELQSSVEEVNKKSPNKACQKKTDIIQNNITTEVKEVSMQPSGKVLEPESLNTSDSNNLIGIATSTAASTEVVNASAGDNESKLQLNSNKEIEGGPIQIKEVKTGVNNEQSIEEHVPKEYEEKLNSSQVEENIEEEEMLQLFQDVPKDED